MRQAFTGTRQFVLEAEKSGNIPRTKDERKLMPSAIRRAHATKLVRRNSIYLCGFFSIAVLIFSGCQTTNGYRAPSLRSVLGKKKVASRLKPQDDTSLANRLVANVNSPNNSTEGSQRKEKLSTGDNLLISPSATVRGQSGNAFSGNRYGPEEIPTPSIRQSPTASGPQYPSTTNQGATGFGYQNSAPATSPSDYNSSIAPGVTGGFGNDDSAVIPGAIPYDPTAGVDPVVGASGYRPRQRTAPIDVFVQEARTGRIIIGGSVNSDLGVAGQIVVDERNFDIRRIPRSWSDLWSGRAFRGGGQNFRAELMPGNRVERYTVSWTERNLFGYLPYSLSVGGFYYTRQFRDWTEQRLGGRIALGYEITKDLSISSELRMEDVTIFDPRFGGVDELDNALGSTDLFTGRIRIAHDTRDSPFMSTQGGLLELVYDQVFGEFDYSRAAINYSRYFRIHERPDGTGRHVIASTWRVGVTGSQTPIFENYFAGGYSTLRGFSFRGASPKVGDIQVGGELQMLGSLEYVFPITADEMLRGVAFVDYGTIEQDLEIDSDNIRVAPGLGLRIAVPALGPAPLAFDFAYALNHADSDDRQVFSFFMGFTR